MEQSEKKVRELIAKHCRNIADKAMTLDLKGNHVAMLDNIIVMAVNLKGAIAYIEEQKEDVVTKA